MKKPTRDNLTRNSETCQEKTPKKPSIFNNKPQIEINSNNLFYSCMFAIHGGDSIQYDSNWNDARAIYLEHLVERIDELIASNTYCHRRVFSFLFTAKKTLRKVYFSINFIANALGMCYRTVVKALNILEDQGLISRVSGKVKHRTNLYFVKTILFIKEFRKVIKKHLRIISDFAPKAFIQQLPTILRNIILRIVNTYNNYFNSNQNMVNKSLDFIEERSSEVKSFPKSETIHFFRRKMEKVRVSSCDMHTTTAAIPHGAITSKKIATEVAKKPENSVLSSNFMLKSLHPSPYASLRGYGGQAKNAICQEKGTVMSNTSLRVAADLEREMIGKKQRASRGPLRITSGEIHDLRRSIAYHYGGYVHKPGDRIMPRDITDYLRKKYNL